MVSPHGDAFPKVKEEQQESHHEDSFPNVSEKEEEGPGYAFPKVKEEQQESHHEDYFPKVSDEEDERLGDVFFPKVKEEQQESHCEYYFPMVNEEEEERPEDSFAKAVGEADAHPEVRKEEEEHPGDAFVKVVKKKQAHPGDSSFQVKKEDEFTQSGSACRLGSGFHEPQNNLQAEEEEAGDDDVPKPTEYQPPAFSSYRPNPPSRANLDIGTFTVQCAKCFKWRIVPTKAKYEEIRQNISQQRFVCDSAQEWRPDITCEVPTDINQDNSRLWAIDKPNIAQPPPGWERLVTIRSEGCTKFADVYYVAPSGKKLRSTVEIQKYLLKHPEMSSGVTLAQFSFRIPTPLQENYVRKRVPVPPVPSSSNCVEPTEAMNPLPGNGPVGNIEFQIPEQVALSNSFNEAPAFRTTSPSPKKQKTTSTDKPTSSGNPDSGV